VALALSATSLAWALGELAQKPGKAGCIADGGGECEDGTGLHGASSLTVSPDGRSVYVASFVSGAVSVFDRDPTTGVLRQKAGEAGCISEVADDGCKVGAGLDDAEGVTVSPDGRSVYVASQNSNAVAVFERDPNTGALTQLSGKAACIAERATEGCEGGVGLAGAAVVTVSPDGENVYVASSTSDAVAVFKRSQSTGALTQLSGKAACTAEELGEGCEDGAGLDNAEGVTVSPDGRSVYVASLFSGAVAVFERDPSTGALTQKREKDGCISETGNDGCHGGAGLGGASDVTVSPDGRSVYVASSSSNAVAVFERDLNTGVLTQKFGMAGCTAEILGDGCEDGTGLLGASSVTVSPDGKSVYVASFASDAVAVFDRDASTGVLMQKAGEAGCIAEVADDGCKVGTGLDSAHAVTVSPDGKSVYAASSSSNAVAVFDRVPEPAASPPVTALPDRTPPTVSGFKLAPSKFKARGGSHLRFALSEVASAKVTIAAAPRGKASKRFVPKGKLSFASLRAGANSIAFKGRVGGRRLAPGRYRAQITATDAAGNRSKPASAGFTVLPAAKRP
jgi:DNA-binding beta-propeller fold protein YncE